MTVNGHKTKIVEAAAMKLHLVDDYAAPACGLRHGRTTADPDEVTCARCRRTAAYRWEVEWQRSKPEYRNAPGSGW